MVAGVLGWLIAAGPANPLPLFTFLLATAGVLATPLLQAVPAELVPADSRGAAVALGSTSFTLAQAAGPASSQAVRFPETCARST